MPSRKISSRAQALSLLIPFVLLLTGGTPSTTKIPEETITLPAASLPEFKTDPHIVESQGNQISGVVRVILQDQRGWIWFGTQDGLSRCDGESLVYFDLHDIHGQTVTVKAIVEDHEGNLWIGSTGGVSKYDGKFFTNYTEKDGLVSDDVWCMYVDRAGSVWIGTIEGVCRFDGKTFTPFPLPATKRNPNRGVSSPTMVRWITQDRAGKMWFAAEGRVYKYNGQDLETVSVMDQESETHVSCILEDESGTIWFATDEKGVIRLDGDTFTNITEQQGLGGVEAGSLYEDSSGRIWFPAEGLGVCRYDGSSLTSISEQDGLATPSTFCITEDQDGRMWFGGWRGAYRYDGESMVNVTRDGPW